MAFNQIQAKKIFGDKKNNKLLGTTVKLLPLVATSMVADTLDLGSIKYENEQKICQGINNIIPNILKNEEYGRLNQILEIMENKLHYENLKKNTEIYIFKQIGYKAGDYAINKNYEKIDELITFINETPVEQNIKEITLDKTYQYFYTSITEISPYSKRKEFASKNNVFKLIEKYANYNLKKAEDNSNEDRKTAYVNAAKAYKLMAEITDKEKYWKKSTKCYNKATDLNYGN